MKIKKRLSSKSLSSNKLSPFSVKAKNNRFKHPRLRPVALAIALAFSTTAPSIAQATTYVVTNTNDSGIGSLRRAVFDANNVTPGAADTIEFSTPVGSIINLASELIVTDSVTIKGPVTGDASSIILDGGGAPSGNRHINAGGFTNGSGQNITLENITLQNGFFDGTAFGTGFGGGAIFVKNAGLTAKHILITNNSTTGDFAKGGGLFVLGDVTLTQSIISGNSTAGNSAEGGGLYVNGNTSISQCTISNNSTVGTQADGGGLFVLGDLLTLTQTTISSNTTTGVNADGGGVVIDHTNATIIQSTISDNSTSGASAKGGGFLTYDDENTSTIFKQSTIVNNSSVSGPGGIYAVKGYDEIYDTDGITLSNSILSNNTGPKGNFHSVFLAVGIFQLTIEASNSLFGDPISEISDPVNSFNYLSNAPDLGPLQHNGGLTKTHKPNETSPAFNSGNNAEAAGLITDQRGSGFPRIHNGTVDIGAVELQNNIIAGDAPLSIGVVLTRRDMARIIIKERHAPGYTPPPATGLVYTDVKIGDINADWIEQLDAEGLTEGCAANVQLTTTRFCPDSVVMREEMAKTVFKGITSAAPNPTNVNFTDIGGLTGFNRTWIDAAYEFGGITQGCAIDKYCPKEPVTRKWVDGDLLVEF